MSVVEAPEPAGLSRSLVTSEPCVNCGASVSAHFCPECGEKRASDRDNRFWAFCKDAFESATNFDGALLRSVKLLFRMPGELTRLHMRGRRVGLIRPMQLFLLVNVIYFVFATAFNNRVFMTTLGAHMSATWHSGLASRLVNEKLGDGTVTAAEYERRFEAYRREFDRVTAVQAKSLLVIMVPAFALLVGLLHMRRKFFVVHHVVYALHTYSAFLMLIVAITLAIGLPAALLETALGIDFGNSKLFDRLFGAVAVSIFGWYAYASLRRGYGDSPRFAALVTPILMAGMVLIVFGYRTVLFLMTYWAT